MLSWPPQDLPTAADLVRGPWSVCEQAAAGSGSAPRSTLAGGQLASISPTQAELLEREPGEPGPQAISPSQLTAHLSGTSIPDHGLPVQPPALASTSSPLCIDYGTGPGGGPRSSTWCRPAPRWIPP